MLPITLLSFHPLSIFLYVYTELKTLHYGTNLAKWDNISKKMQFWETALFASKVKINIYTHVQSISTFLGYFVKTNIMENLIISFEIIFFILLFLFYCTIFPVLSFQVLACLKNRNPFIVV